MEQDRARQEAQARLEKARAEAEEARKRAEEARARADANEERLKKAREEFDKARQERKGGIGKAEKELKEAERPEKEAEKAEKSASAKAREEHLSSLLAADSHQHGEESGCVTRCLWDKARPPTWRRRCLFRGHNHRENGVKYQLANESDWYNLDFRERNSESRKRLNKEFSDAQLGVRKPVNNPTISKDCWWMSKYGANFRINNRPWKNEAHHIIPIEALATHFDGKLLLLQAVKYNVNIGVNIIMLPINEKHARVYQLPSHPSNHPDYNRSLKRMLDSISNKFGKEKEKQGGHPEMSAENPGNHRTNLNNFSLGMRIQLRDFAIEKAKAGAPLHINDIFKPIR
ncbi:AHH domain-containing protein [Archangium violaceum]|uniref:AHH domain-containing protein n=1 Tax=Archangium violaceum TaxID=83451 RepID=UPI00193C3D60|nr:AHH domain-containing protein [Archangium violaceum]QRK12592.1 AHH domain-containing protein [Archangium violaceum]